MRLMLSIVLLLATVLTTEQSVNIQRLVIPSDIWMRVGETVPLNTEAYDENNQQLRLLPASVDYVVTVPPNGRSVLTINASTHMVTAQLTGTAKVKAISGTVQSKDILILVLPPFVSSLPDAKPIPTPPQPPITQVSGYVKVNGDYFGPATVTLTNNAGTRSFAANAGGYFFFENCFVGDVLSATALGYSFVSITIDDTSPYYLIDGQPAP